MKTILSRFSAVLAAALCGGFSAFAGATYDATSIEGSLIVTVDADGATMDAAQVTAGITNIIKRGEGKLTAATLTNYEGDFSLEGGVYEAGIASSFGKTYVGTINVRDGATVLYSAAKYNTMLGKVLNFFGAPATGQKAKLIARNSSVYMPGWVKRVNLMGGDATVKSESSARVIFSGTVLDLQQNKLTLTGSQSVISGVVTNGGAIVVEGTFMGENASIEFAADSAATGYVEVKKNGEMNLKDVQTANGWKLICHDGGHIRGNVNRWPTDTEFPRWNGPIELDGTVDIASYTGNYGVSNTVYNIQGPLAGEGKLLVGPGWLNLHHAINSYAGSVIVSGKSPASTPVASRVLAGGGGIGIWNGAACFPEATSITLTNSARFALMDNTKAELPVLTFANSSDDQSFTGGSFAEGHRSVSAGLVKSSASTLLIDSPVSITGAVTVSAGTLKIANRARYGTPGLNAYHLQSVTKGYNGKISDSTKLWDLDLTKVTCDDLGLEPTGAAKIYSGLEAPGLDGGGERLRHGYWYTGYVWNRSPSNETWQILADYSNPNVTVYVGDKHTKLDISQNADNNPLKPAELVLPPGPTRIDLWMFTWATGGDTCPSKFNKLGLSFARYPVVAPADFTGTAEQLAPFVQMKEDGRGGLFTLTNDEPTVSEGAYEPLPILDELTMSAGTTLDLSANVVFRLGTLVGAPTVVNAPYLAVTEGWAIRAAESSETLTTDGELAFAAGATLDVGSGFLRPGPDGCLIAHAAGGIAGLPTLTKNQWRLALSQDGKDLRLFFKPGFALFFR